MMRLLAWLLICISLPVFADLDSYVATYSVTSGKLKIGTIQRQLETDRQAYTLTVTTHASVPMVSLGGTEQSRGHWQGLTPIPDVYSYKYKHKGKIKEKIITFENNKANYQNQPIKLHPNTQDKLSYQLLLRNQLQSGKTDYEFAVINGHKVKSYDFHVIGKEKISTPAGQFKTIVIERESNQHHTILWLAPELNNMIIKVSFATEGKFNVTAQLKSFKVKNTI